MGGSPQQKVRGSEFYDTAFLTMSVYYTYCSVEVEAENDYIINSVCISRTNPTHHTAQVDLLILLLLLRSSPLPIRQSCLSSVVRRALSKPHHLQKRRIRGKRAVGDDQPVRPYSSHLLPPS